MPPPSPTRPISIPPKPPEGVVNKKEVEQLVAYVNNVNISSKPYIEVTVNGVRCEALPDSGNTWESVMSVNFYRRLKGELSDLIPTNTRVGTAKKEEQLNVLGQVPKNLYLRVEGVPYAFPFKPMIIDGLSMDLNLSKRFMEKNGWDQLHSQKIIEIRGIKVKPDTTAIYAARACRIPPKSVVFISAMMVGPQREGRPATLVFNEPHKGPMQGLNAVVCDSKQEAEPDEFPLVEVRNHGDEEKVILEGQLISHWDYETENVYSIQMNDQFPMSKKQKTEKFFREFAERQEKEEGIAVEPKKKTRILAENWTGKEKKEWIKKEFQLGKEDALKNRHDIENAANCLAEFFDLFSLNGEFGRTHLIEHEIITEAVYPVKNKGRPLSKYLEKDLARQIQEWLAQDLIEPSTSAWGSNLVPVPKKNDKVRWCVDYRGLNKVTKPDAFPMPEVQDNLMRLGGNKIFSAIDAMGAFWTIPVKKSDREKLAFFTPMGLFQWKCVPFGVINGPATFCRLVAKIMENIPDKACKSFLDDFLIVGRDLQQHLQHMRLTLTEYRKSGLKLEPKKCHFFKLKTNYLGYEISERGIRPPESFVKAIALWPVPTFRTQARSFLGFCNYYRRHCPKLAELTASWTDKVGKGTREEEKEPLVVSDQMIADFQRLKRILTSPPLLGFPFFGGPKAGEMTLDTDFCQVAIGGVLSQQQKGKEVVLGYGSKKLNKNQRNYGSTKGELFAVCFFMSYFRPLLQYGKKFRLRTDHAALKYIQTLNAPAAMMDRWLGTLGDFNFYVEYRKGTRHVNADLASRDAYMEEIGSQEGAEGYALPFAEVQAVKEVLEDEDEEELHRHEPLGDANPFAVAYRQRLKELKMQTMLSNEDSKKKEKQIASLKALNTRSQWECLSQWDTAKLVEAQEKDEDLKIVRDWLKSATPPEKSEISAQSADAQMYATLLTYCSITKVGLIAYAPPVGVDGFSRVLICLPRDFWEVAVRAVHLLLKHSAHDRTYKELRRTAFFPGMRRFIALFLLNCHICQVKGQREPKPKHRYEGLRAGYPFQLVHIDVFGPLSPPAPNGEKYLLTMKDNFSRWVCASGLKKQTAEEIAFALEKDLFMIYGIPEVLFSDMAPNLTGHLMQSIAQSLNIKLINTTGYHPQPNSCRTIASRSRSYASNANQRFKTVMVQMPSSMPLRHEHGC